jgi:hypothetical protein
MVVARRLLLSVMLLGIGIFASHAEDAGLRPGIRAAVAEINAKLPGFKKETRLVEGLSLEGSEATFFSEGGTLRKISAKLYGETYNATAELYYHGGALSFVYQKVNRYDTQIGMQPPPKVASSEEKRHYFSGGALAALRIGQRDIEASDILWDEAEQEIAALAEMLEHAFAKP